MTRYRGYRIELRPHQEKGRIGVARFGVGWSYQHSGNKPGGGTMFDEKEESVHFLSWFPIRIDPQLDYNMLKDAIAEGPEARIRMHNKFYNID
jgi:hypothetical protein